jgi:hypothetical protein
MGVPPLCGVGLLAGSATGLGAALLRWPFRAVVRRHCALAHRSSPPNASSDKRFVNGLQ